MDKLKLKLIIVNMNLSEFQALRDLKHSSNVLFHGIKKSTDQDALNKLYTLYFSDYMKKYKAPLEKALKALIKWKK